MPNQRAVRFIPSGVEGLPDVTEVAVYPDRLELLSAGRRVSFRFNDMIEWPRPAFLRRWLARFGWRPRRPPVGERDWFHPPSERFFRFYTRPALVVYMPDEPADTPYGSSVFDRVRDIIGQGGFSTWDLG